MRLMSSLSATNALRLLQTMTVLTEQARQIDPTGKSILIYRNYVKSRNQKYFALSEVKPMA